jgi:putative ABC transport system ATP-binding protein
MESTLEQPTQSETPREEIVVARGLERTFGTGEAQVRALVDVDVAFERSRYTSIMGPSGSGKSTLMHILAGLDRPTAGTVEIDGVEITGLDDGELTDLRRDKLGFVFQFFNLLPVLTAEENIVLPLSIARKKPDKEWVDLLIDRVGLDDRRTHRPSELSGGQQQRVAIARAIASNPAVVLADEPTANVDSETAEKLLDIMEKLNRDRGITFLFSTHDPRVMERARRVVRIVDGRVERDDP